MSVHNNFGSAFKAMYRKLESVQRSLPNVLANEGTKFFISNFDLGGFTDVNFDAWVPRKDKKNTGRKILVKTGKLRRAVNKSVKEKNYKRIVWKIDTGEVPYAAIHNEGFNGKVTTYSYSRGTYKKTKVGTGVYSIKTRKEGKRTVKEKTGSTLVRSSIKNMNMPRRHFMGNSEFLNKRLRLRIKEAYNKAFSS